MSPDGPDLRHLVDPVVVFAFSGWNDAAGAATAAVEHLRAVTDAELVFSLDPDDFYDFQVNRPVVTRTADDQGEVLAEIDWPTTTVSVGRWQGEFGPSDLVLVVGPEPNLRWRTFTARLTSLLRTVDPTLVVALGALLADVAHSRPVPVHATSPDAQLQEAEGLSASRYEGPAGITGVLSDACARAGFPTMSLWAAVPHYVAHPPNPKATMALLRRIEDTLGGVIDMGELDELTRAWERGVAELATEDAEIAEYIEQLEAESDEAELPEASGDAIAAEFERYLRHRRDHPPTTGPEPPD